jgi:predicted DsbA family dithiol-disulfide isomerase
MARIEASRPRFAAMMWEAYGVEINPGEFGIISRPALIAARFADAQGKGDAFHDAMFRAYWVEARNIADLHVIRAVAEQVGLDGEAALASVTHTDYIERVDADIMQAYQYGLSAVPAIVFEQKYLVMGAQPVEVLLQVAQRILSERA